MTADIFLIKYLMAIDTNNVQLKKKILFYNHSIFSINVLQNYDCHRWFCTFIDVANQK
jgi:hypothetical protein